MKSHFFRFRVDKCELPDGRVMPSYYVMDFTDWVHVVALTKAGEFVMIRQYRHAIERVTLEVPGGAIHAKHGEAPEAAGLRELTEETGYKAGRVVALGSHSPNPALQSNRMWLFLALDCELVGGQTLDPYEDIEVELLPRAQLEAAIAEGKIEHSLVIASLYFAENYLKKSEF
jgi:8-oxo-dGTP pyrophosphatase MutT (NUDIX family)